MMRIVNDGDQVWFSPDSDAERQWLRNNVEQYADESTLTLPHDKGEALSDAWFLEMFPADTTIELPEKY